MSIADEEFKRLFKGTNVFDREKIEPQLTSFLRDHPDCVPALCLRGHMLEYEIALEQSQTTDVDAFDPRFEIIRTSYEIALQADPYCVQAAIDLGDYWNDFANDAERAIEYYDRAILLLRSGQCTEDRETELKDAYSGKIEALLTLNKKAAAIDCQKQAVADGCVDDMKDLA